MRNLSLAIFLLITGGVSGFSQQQVPPLNQVPSRVVGHPVPEVSANSASPNLVEGREFWLPYGIAVDTSVSPPILYVADLGNSRVLGFRDATAGGSGRAPVADLVIGQQDLYHTSANRGGTTTAAAGLFEPTGLAVDSDGNLYVADNGNNRILRFKKPFANTGDQVPDLYIGQRTPALGVAGTANNALTLTRGVPVGLAFDTAGNLWATDPGNRRVLRFPKDQVMAGGGSNDVKADLVIGQANFDTPLRNAVSTTTRTTNNAFATPMALAFDGSGRLYVADTNENGNSNVSRVLVFAPPFTTDAAAVRIMGIANCTTCGPNVTNAASTQDQLERTSLFSPSAIFFFPGSNRMGILDARRFRILIYDAFENWDPQTTLYSPLAVGVFGQPDYHVNSITLVVPPTTGSFYLPRAAVIANSELYLADTFNNRLLVLPASGGNLSQAVRLFGQDRFDMSSPNLIEGREFSFTGTRVSVSGFCVAGNSSSGACDAGLAVDTTGSEPHMYVADPYNNRVLGFKDYRTIKAGSKADIVIGQGDFNLGLCNQTGNVDKPTPSTLCEPTGVAVDLKGNLYVADHGNGRVLRFPTPFTHTTQQADLVLGKPNFSSANFPDALSTNLAAPYSVAVAQANGIVVADEFQNRVLYFAFSAGGDFNSPADIGKAATKVLGQPDFTSRGSGTGLNRLNAPRHVTVDSGARIYVADTGNNRVLIFEQIASPLTPDRDATAVLNLSVNSPRALYVNPLNDDLWVGDSNGQTMKKYPPFAKLIIDQTSTGSVSVAGIPLAVVQDEYGAMAVADQTNRIAWYFPGVQGMNAANYIPSAALAPGSFASICASNSNCLTDVSIFGSTTTDFGGVVPLPKQLGDVQVTVAGVAAPMTYLSPRQINFVVPKSAPASGTADVEVLQASTGRVLASGTVRMNPVSPGVFMLNFTGASRQAAIVNNDGTINGPNNPAARGSYVSIYATGQGVVPNMPEDGVPPSGLVNTPFTPTVIFGGLTSPVIQFSGLSYYPGLWQINAQVPSNLAPTQPATSVPPHAVLVLANSTASNNFSVSGYNVVIYVK